MVIWVVLLLTHNHPAVLPNISFQTKDACVAFATVVLGSLPFTCVSVEREAAIS